MYLGELSARVNHPMQKQELTMNIILFVINWLWLFVSLFGLNYHVPFRLSKIKFDCFGVSEFKREIIPALVRVLIFVNTSFLASMKKKIKMKQYEWIAQKKSIGRYMTWVFKLRQSQIIYNKREHNMFHTYPFELSRSHTKNFPNIVTCIEC